MEGVRVKTANVWRYSSFKRHDNKVEVKRRPGLTYVHCHFNRVFISF